MRNLFRSLAAFYHKHPGKIRVGLVVVLFAILFSSIHPAEILQAYRDADPSYLFIALLLLVPNLLLQHLKWSFILRVLEPKPSAYQVLKSLFGGFFLAASTPGRTGEMARGIFFPDHSTVRIASLTVVDKGFSQLMVYLFGLVALSLNLPMPYTIIPYLVIVVILFVVFNVHRLRPTLERLLHKVTHSEMVDNALAAFDALSFGTVLGMMLYSIVFYLTFTTQFFFILNCFTDVPVDIGIRAIPLIFLINSALPISIGDFGMKDFAAVQVLGQFGVPGAAVFSSTLTQNVMTFLVPSLLGGIMFSVTKHPTIREAAPSADHTAPEKDA